MSREGSTSEDPRGSWADRLLTALPHPPRLRGKPLIWLALGVSHGAWLITYTELPEDLVMWVGIGVAVLLQITS